MAKRKSKLANKKKPDVHPELQGFNIEINKLGEINYTHNIDEINEFLDDKIKDKKTKKKNSFKNNKKKK